MYVIGIIETQFFAYLQLIRRRLSLLNIRLSLLNKRLIQFGKIVNENKNHTNFPGTVDEVTQINSNSFEYFVSRNNPIGMNEMFKTPSVNCTRYILLRIDGFIKYALHQINIYCVLLFCINIFFLVDTTIIQLQEAFHYVLRRRIICHNPLILVMK